VTASVKFDPKVVPHAKGYCFNVVSEVFSSPAMAELLWRCESTYLFRARAGLPGAAAETYASKFKETDLEVS
jgi:hypothetical protein